MTIYADPFIDVPVGPDVPPEESHIDPKRFYFALTPEEYLLYSWEKHTWYCLRTGLVIPGRISDIIDVKGDMWLPVAGKPVTSGKWGHADSLDVLLDFYNSGDYLTWLNNLS